MTAAWWPVAITSVSASSDGISASSSPTRSATSVPSASGTRTAFALPAVHVVGAVPAAVDARALEPLAAELAVAVRVHERRDHDVAGPQRPHLGADRLDHADEVVAHLAALLVVLHRLVRPQVAAADRCPRDDDERIGRIAATGVAYVLDPDVARVVHHGCAHSKLLFPAVRLAATIDWLH